MAGIATPFFHLRGCCVALTLGVVALSGVRSPAARAAIYEEAPPRPVGMARLRRPTIFWKIWPRGDTVVSRVEMTLNGKSVPARYDATGHMVEYVPADPLASGVYDAECTAVFGDGLPATRKWSFIIADDARASLPEPGEDQRLLCDAVNVYRAAVSLPPMRLHPSLCAAAEAHAGYLQRNNLNGHMEQEGLLGYTGRDPLDRVVAFGYANSCMEAVQLGCKIPAEAVASLFDAPYHRLPFLQPGIVDFGGFSRDGWTSLEFGMPKDAGVVVYPADGQKGIPTLWNGMETPNPLRMHNATGPVGYVATFYAMLAPGEQIRVDGARLNTAEGEEVPVYVNTPTCDEILPNGVFLIPKAPLSPFTEYVAAVKATDPQGRDISRTWSFTTGEAPAPEIPPPPPPAPVHLDVTIRRFNLADGRREWDLSLKNTAPDPSGPLIVTLTDDQDRTLIRETLEAPAGGTAKTTLPITCLSGRLEIRSGRLKPDGDAPLYTLTFSR
jgi:hypothetical protein